MLTEEQRAAWVVEHGPWLYWALSEPRLWPWVLRDGIQPGDVTGQPGMQRRMKSRPGHIYFMTDCTPAARPAAGVVNEPQVRVDIRQLELRRLATDEDRIEGHIALSNHASEVKCLPRRTELTPRGSGVLTGVWMNDHSDIVDQPEWVWHSMTTLTVAYRGSVRAEELDILPLHVLHDWKPASAGARYADHSRRTPAAYYIGEPDNHPT